MAVSNANMIMNGRAGPAIPAEQESDGANLAHFRNEVAKQVFDAVPERRGRAWASRARTFHVQKHDAIAKAMESDVAAVLCDRRADPGVEQLLDGRDYLLVGVIEILILSDLRSLSGEDRQAGQIMLHDHPENRRLKLLPLAFSFGHGHEILAKEHSFDAIDREEPLGERRFLRLLRRAVVA